MSIASHLSRIKTNINNSLNQLLNKGVTIPEGANSDNLVDLINSVPQHSEYPNGREWTECTLDTNLSDWIKNFVQVDDSVIYAYNSTEILKSTDGINWTHINHNIPNNISTIIYYKRLFIAVTSAQIMYSEDMITWIQGIEFTGNLIVSEGLLVGYGMGRNILVSDDGKNWEIITCLTDYSIQSVLYNKHKFVVDCGNGGVKVSNDFGNTWSDSVFEGITVNKNIYAIKYVDGLYVTYVSVSSDTSLSGIFYSYDGETWYRSNGVSINRFPNLFYSGNKWYVQDLSDYKLYCSIDGINWTQCIFNVTSHIGSIIYENGLYLLCTNDYKHKILCSEDGTEWFNSDMNMTTEEPSVDNLIYSHGIYLAASSSAFLWYSINGKEWSKAVRYTPSNIVTFKNILIGVNNFYMKIYYSTIWDNKSTILTNISDEILVDSVGNILTTL